MILMKKTKCFERVIRMTGEGGSVAVSLKGCLESNSIIAIIVTVVVIIGHHVKWGAKAGRVFISIDVSLSEE